MMFSDLIKLLKERHYKEKAIEDLWDNLCQKVILSIFSIYNSLSLYDMDNAEKRFFHIFTIDFMIDDNLNSWVTNINSDPRFTKKKTIFDKPKQNMLEDILKNVALKIVKNLEFKAFNDLVVKEHHKQKFKDITTQLLKMSKPSSKFLRVPKDVEKPMEPVYSKTSKNSDIFSPKRLGDQELQWTDEEAIKTRLFDKIESEREKIRPKQGAKKMCGFNKIPSVQAIINVVSINEKLPPNKYNMLDLGKIEEEERRRKMKGIIDRRQQEELERLAEYEDFNLTQQRHIEEKTPAELLAQVEATLNCTVYSQFADGAKWVLTNMNESEIYKAFKQIFLN